MDLSFRKSYTGPAQPGKYNKKKAEAKSWHNL
jgi:hypothetical protein